MRNYLNVIILLCPDGLLSISLWLTKTILLLLCLKVLIWQHNCINFKARWLNRKIFL